VRRGEQGSNLWQSADDGALLVFLGDLGALGGKLSSTNSRNNRQSKFANWQLAIDN
jgi:hypothetical protein